MTPAVMLLCLAISIPNGDCNEEKPSGFHRYSGVERWHIIVSESVPEGDRAAISKTFKTGLRKRGIMLLPGAPDPRPGTAVIGFAVACNESHCAVEVSVLRIGLVGTLGKAYKSVPVLVWSKIYLTEASGLRKLARVAMEDLGEDYANHRVGKKT